MSTCYYFNAMPFGIMLNDSFELPYNQWYSKATLPEIRDRVSGRLGWVDADTCVILPYTRLKEWLNWGGVGKPFPVMFLRPVEWNGKLKRMQCTIVEEFETEEVLDWNKIIRYNSVTDLVNDAYHREIHRLVSLGVNYDDARTRADEKAMYSNPDKLLAEIPLVKTSDLRSRRYVLK